MPFCHRRPYYRFGHAGLSGLAALVLLLCYPLQAHAVIVLGSEAGAESNASPPTGALKDSGWQYMGRWGGFQGIAIAPHFFITAKHVGGSVGESFVLNADGRAYTAEKCFVSPRTDLSIWRVREPMPTWAPCYTGDAEKDRQIIVFGRGTQRGSAVVVDGETRGWCWGSNDGRMRWGLNRVNSAAGQMLSFSFDRDTREGENECCLSGGDSGGGVFLQDKGVWKLAGVNSAVQGHYARHDHGADRFAAALFDARGLYLASFVSRARYLSPSLLHPQPSVSYATRTAANQSFIQEVLSGRTKIPGTYPLSRRIQAGFLLASLSVAGLAAALLNRLWRRRKLGSSPALLS